MVESSARRSTSLLWYMPVSAVPTYRRCIATHLDVSGNVGVAASSLVITRRLCLVMRLKHVDCSGIRREVSMPPIAQA